MDRNLRVNKEILFYAFRYALGRATYAPGLVMNDIKANIDNISTKDIKAYIREITECENYGMTIDEKHWLDFKRYLQDELSNREHLQ